jgi:hypothetical protein
MSRNPGIKARKKIPLAAQIGAFFNKSANLIIIGQEYAAAKMEEFLKMPTRIAYWS